MAGNDDDVYGEFLARSYASEQTAQAQWDAFQHWLEAGRIDGVTAWRVEHRGAVVIAVFDLSGRSREFAWTGDPFELSDYDMEALIARVDRGSYRHESRPWRRERVPSAPRWQQHG
jgi:hypothetical protein